MAETEKLEQQRQHLIDTFGSKPPKGTILPFLETGYAYVVDTRFVRTNGKGRHMFLGINPDKGWVVTNIEVDTTLGG